MGGLIVRRLENTSDKHADSIAGWEFLAADIKRIESVGAVSAVFEELFFLFGELFA